MQAFGLCDSKDVARAPTTACLGVRDTWERIEVMMKKEHKRDRKLAKVTRECEGQVCLVTEAMPMALWVCACLCIIFSYAELVPLTIVCALCMQLFLVLGRDPIMIGVDAIDDVADRQTCAGWDGHEDAHTLWNFVWITLVLIVVMCGAMSNDRDVESRNHLWSQIPRRINHDIARVTTCQHGKHTLLLVENGEILSTMAVDHRIGVNSNEQVITKLTSVAQEVNVACVKHVPPTINVYDPGIVPRWRTVLCKQTHHLRCCQELAFTNEHFRFLCAGGLLLSNALPSQWIVTFCVMLPSRKKHPTDNFCRRYSFGARDRPINAELACGLINIAPVNNARIITMYDNVDFVFLDGPVQILLGHDIWDSWDNLIHPFASAHGRKALVLAHYWWAALALGDRSVIINTNHQMSAKSPTFSECIRVAKVHHIERPVHPNPDLPILGRTGRLSGFNLLPQILCTTL
mmetsp:Transcript_16016/g.48623  ORF Transcript_16016/g.48623 Transcript_16016/m.48623 type:complete len:461 (-) Transcript_16016:205-1587(-)